MDVVTEVKEILREVLQLGERADALDSESALFGNLPELDSLAVASVMMALEERFGIVVEDDLSADHFETLGSLARFAEQQM
jgi:acyl carrier protein